MVALIIFIYKNVGTSLSGVLHLKSVPTMPLEEIKTRCRMKYQLYRPWYAHKGQAAEINTCIWVFRSNILSETKIYSFYP